MDTKKCSRCGIEKPISEYHRKSDSPDGLRSKCKPCRSQEFKEYMGREGKKEIARLKVCRWRMTEKGKLSNRETRRRYNETEIGKEMGRTSSKIHRERYPDRIKSRKALWWAVESGKMKRAEYCTKCGVRCKTHGHHHNGHNQEHWLDVIWLCRACHTEVHREKRAVNV
jgi:hypothetical protein